MTPPRPAPDPPAPPLKQRLDRWLWFARFLKSRTLAARLVASGKMRVNGEKTAKASHMVEAGDVLTFPLAPHIRVIRIEAPGARRGPAAEARTLYEDLSPPDAPPQGSSAQGPGKRPPEPGKRPKGAGRPTKAERRQIDRMKGDIGDDIP